MARPALSDSDVEQMRQRICAATLQIYAEGGYPAVTFRNVATRLGISHTLIYRYFRDKEELLTRLRIDCVVRFREHLIASDPHDRGPLARIYAMAYAGVHYVLHHPAEYRLIYSLNQPDLETVQELMAERQATFDHMVGVVQQAIDAGLVQADARTLTHIIWTCSHGLFTLHSANQLVHGRSLEELIKPTLETVLGPLLGPQPESLQKPGVTS